MRYLYETCFIRKLVLQEVFLIVCVFVNLFTKEQDWGSSCTRAPLASRVVAIESHGDSHRPILNIVISLTCSHSRSQTCGNAGGSGAGLQRLPPAKARIISLCLSFQVSHAYVSTFVRTIRSQLCSGFRRRRQMQSSHYFTLPVPPEIYILTFMFVETTRSLRCGGRCRRRSVRPCGKPFAANGRNVKRTFKASPLTVTG